MMMGCDTLLTVGSSFPYTQFLPTFDQARAVQIDIDPSLIGMRYPYEVNLVGDAAATLRALLRCCSRKDDRKWREGIESDVARWWETMAMEAARRGRPGQPDAAVRASCRRGCPRTRSSPPTPARRRTGTPGSCASAATMRGSLSGNLATMGPGVPYGIGAKFGCPDRPVIVFAGRRRDADERPGRTDHGQAVLGDSGPTRAWWSRCCTTTTSTRSPGRCGRWRARRSSSSASRCPTSTTPGSPQASACRGSRSTSPTTSARRGTGRWPRTGRRCWTCAPTPTCRRSRRTPRPTRCSPRPRRCSPGDEDRWGVMRRGVKTKLQEFLPHRGAR